MKKLAAWVIVTLVASGCATTTSGPAIIEPVALQTASVDIPEEHLLDVGIEIFDDGRLVTESTTICERLDALSGAPALTGPDRDDVMARAALAQGVIDAAFTAVIEKRRPPERQWPDWIERQQRAIERTLSVTPVPPAGRFDLGDIALACGLGYLDFRLSATGWRSRHGGLAGWLDAVAARPSMRSTQP